MIGIPQRDKSLFLQLNIECISNNFIFTQIAKNYLNIYIHQKTHLLWFAKSSNFMSVILQIISTISLSSLSFLAQYQNLIYYCLFARPLKIKFDLIWKCSEKWLHLQGCQLFVGIPCMQKRSCSEVFAFIYFFNTFNWNQFIVQYLKLFLNQFFPVFCFNIFLWVACVE